MFVVMMTLFALLVVGYVAGKLGYLGGDFDRQLSRMVINITCPALILSSAMNGELPDRQFILPLLGISVITYVLLTGVAFLLPRYLTRQKEHEGTVGFAIMFGNVGFMGYPVVASLFGHQAVFYAAVLNVINTFAVFTVGTILITGKGEVEGSRFQKKVLYSTPMLAAYLTMLIVALRIDNIPEVISLPLTMLGDITVPAALLIIGSSMSQLSVRTLLGNRTVYITTVMRLVVVPVALFFLFQVIGFSEMVNHINTVVIAMPVATYGTILCLRHGKDATLMTEVTFITTLFSMVTIPLLVLLLL
ncbi:MAG: AEC family transporter [Prevotella sp.]|nr:AEC family transporter [Prevotella sp.]